jgi:hypothetical protein
MLGFGVGLGGELVVNDDLRDAAAVAEIEEDEVAVVATAIDPTHEDDPTAGAGVVERDVAAEVGAFESAEKVQLHGND